MFTKHFLKADGLCNSIGLVSVTRPARMLEASSHDSIDQVSFLPGTISGSFSEYVYKFEKMKAFTFFVENLCAILLYNRDPVREDDVLLALWLQISG